VVVPIVVGWSWWVSLCRLVVIRGGVCVLVVVRLVLSLYSVWVCVCVDVVLICFGLGPLG